MFVFENGRVNDPTASIESIEFANLISEFDNPEKNECCKRINPITETVTVKSADGFDVDVACFSVTGK